MKTPAIAIAVSLPPGWVSLPLVLTFNEVVVLTEFWNLGGRHYVRELRECGVITSVNKFKNGRRSRYASAQLVGAVYPGAGRAE